MDHDAPNPAKIVPRPKSRWFQFGLKSLFVLPAVIGLPLALYVYWADWTQNRPPYKDYDDEGFKTAFLGFVEDLAADRLAHAYDSTSPRFKKQMSRSQFEDLIRRNPAVQAWPNAWGLDFPPTEFEAALRRWSTHMIGVMRPDGHVTELWVWVVADTADDSFFHRRPPPPRVEEIQIREMDSPGPSSISFLHPSWERE